MIRIEGLPFDIDIIFELSSGMKFESLRSRASEISIGSGNLTIADLSDIIAAKKAANRPKDMASLPIIEHALVVRREMEGDENNSYGDTIGL